MGNQWALFNKEAWNLFIHPGEVVEVRILKVWGKSPAWNNEFAKGTVSGYFDDFEAFCKAVKAADKVHHEGIYFTLQVIDPRLIARAFNRLKPSNLTTSDLNARRYRFLPVDLDPVRPAGISASDTELHKAMELREKVAQWFKELGFPSPVKGMSGNGGHLVYMLPDTPVSDKVKLFIERVLQGLAARFDTENVKIDRTVFNPARIWKLYGTHARKGDSVPAGPKREARPHRKSYIDSIEGVRPVDKTTLTNLWKMFPPEEPSETHQQKKANPKSNNGKRLNLERYLNHYGISYKMRNKNGAMLYCLDHCIFDDSHTRNEAAIIQQESGMLLYQCFHNSCKGRTWSDARQIISGGDNLFTFMKGLEFDNDGVHNNEKRPNWPA